MTVIYLILLLLALVCFVAAAAGAVFHPRLNLVALGLAFWVLVYVIKVAQQLD